jgi:hypothetical protein
MEKLISQVFKVFLTEIALKKFLFIFISHLEPEPFQVPSLIDFKALKNSLSPKILIK